jgi:hypothetical protein
MAKILSGKIFKNRDHTMKKSCGAQDLPQGFSVSATGPGPCRCQSHGARQDIIDGAVHFSFYRRFWICQAFCPTSTQCNVSWTAASPTTHWQMPTATDHYAVGIQQGQPHAIQRPAKVSGFFLSWQARPIPYLPHRVPVSLPASRNSAVQILVLANWAAACGPDHRVPS